VLDVSFIVDSSGSVGSVSFGKMLQFVKKLVGKLSAANGEVRRSSSRGRVDFP